MTTRFGQEVIRDRLEGSHRGRDVGMTGEEYNRQRLSQAASEAPDR